MLNLKNRWEFSARRQIAKFCEKDEGIEFLNQVFRLQEQSLNHFRAQFDSYLSEI